MIPLKTAKGYHNFSRLFISVIYVCMHSSLRQPVFGILKIAIQLKVTLFVKRAENFRRMAFVVEPEPITADK